MVDRRDQSARDEELRARVAAADNVADILEATAEFCGEIAAVAEAPRRRSRQRQDYPQVSYRELAAMVLGYAGQLQEHGVEPGQRMALLVRPGIDFVALFFALLKTGAVTILIDPGMPRRNLIACLSAAEPAGMVGIRRALLARWLFRRAFPACRHLFSVGGGFPGAIRLQRSSAPPSRFRPPPGEREAPAAIIFTTGSTGPPKGVLYRHRTFLRQAYDVSRYFRISSGGADISGFPLFALFNAAMGVTTVFPHMDFTRPAQVDPRNFLAAVDAWSATQSFGSPALWNTVATYCERHATRLPTIRQVMSAGAPVPARTLDRVQRLIADDGNVHTPYGATEALPVACITAREVLRETAERTRQGAGTCVGRHFPDIRWHTIEIADGPLPTLSACRILPPGQIGELIVNGPVVTDRYVTRTEANALHKILEGEAIWHRMGDVGYLDDQGRFWFCGRKTHRVITAETTLYTIPCEAIFNQHPAAYRSALVGVGQAPAQRPVIVVEPWPERYPRGQRAAAQLLDELHALGRSHALTRSIEEILIRRALPVDIRHNSKIFREQLAVWAARRLRASSEKSTRETA